jgi:hypothetical protein
MSLSNYNENNENNMNNMNIRSHIIYIRYNLYNEENKDNNEDESEEKEINKFYSGTFSKPYSGENKEECNICLDNDSFTYKSWVKLGCNHYFHKHCIDLWTSVRPTCPICRQNVHQSYKSYIINKNGFKNAMTVYVFFNLMIIGLVLLILNK